MITTITPISNGQEPARVTGRNRPWFVGVLPCPRCQCAVAMTHQIEPGGAMRDRWKIGGHTNVLCGDVYRFGGSVKVADWRMLPPVGERVGEGAKEWTPRAYAWAVRKQVEEWRRRVVAGWSAPGAKNRAGE